MKPMNFKGKWLAGIKYGVIQLLFGLAFHSIYASTLTIHAVGDILLHRKLQHKGIHQGFEQIWQGVIPFVSKADIAYANLEGPVAANVNRRGKAVLKPSDWQNIYTSFPMFNYHPSLVPALKQSGFDIVSTANNHSLDRFALGVDKTIDELDKHQLNYVGSRHRTHDQSWYRIIEKNGIKTAWLSCTQDTNGLGDRYKQILYCYKKSDRLLLLELVSNLRNQVDIIVLSPHWGMEYHHTPSKQQKIMAKRWLEAGVDIIIGAHPHVVQPIKRYQTKDGRLGVIAYSMGNFVSNQGSLKNRSSGVLSITLEKDGQQTKVSKIRFYPTYMQNRGGRLNLEWVQSKRHPSYRLLKRVLGESYLRLKKPD